MTKVLNTESLRDSIELNCADCSQLTDRVNDSQISILFVKVSPATKK